MNSRRPSHMRASSAFRSLDDGDLVSFSSRFSVRPSTLLRPSMMPSELMQQHESMDAPPSAGMRRRSLSTDSDRASGKLRPSVPLLYASAISSMSTLSSSFYQYDSTDAVVPEIHAQTPVSSAGSGDQNARRKGGSSSSKKGSSQDATLQLPPVQQRMIRKDAFRMTRDLIHEQVQALDMTNKRVLVSHSGALGAIVAEAKGIKVFEKPGLGTGLLRAKKHHMKRYSAQWQLNATIDEIVELLQRNDDCTDSYMSCQTMLSPETVNCKLLWRDVLSKDQQFRLGENDDDDVTPVIVIDAPEDEEFVMFSDRGGAKNMPRRHPKPRSAVSSIKSKTSSSSRRGDRKSSARKAVDWLGINWWVQHLPLTLSRDRDFIVMESQREFEAPASPHHSAKGSSARRGFVHLRHSVDLADLATNEKKLLSPFVRGQIIQSGLVVIENDEPGVLDVSSTLEIDCGGHVSASQHRHLVVKRLQAQLENLSEMLWKMRLLKTQRLFGPAMPRLDKKSNLSRCHRCPYKPSRWGSRRSMDMCRACEHVVCGNCSSPTEFQPFLVAAALPAGQHNVQSVDNDDLKARVCAFCVLDFSRPRLTRHQSSADTYSAEIDDHFDPGDDDDDDDDRYNPRMDAVRTALPPSFHYRQQPPQQQQQQQYHTQYHPYHQERSQPPLSMAASSHDEPEWQPSRSSRIAEDLVDDFLTSFKSDPHALPDFMVAASPGLLSPSALSDSERQFEPESVPQAAPAANVMMSSAAWQRRVSRADVAHRPSVSSYTPLQGHDPAPPRRKLSIFETIPEPPPRKNVVLYEL